MNGSLYPPSVQGVPPGLTTPSYAYRRQVVFVLLSLFLFLLIYLGLVGYSAWVLLYAFGNLLSAPRGGDGRSPDDTAYWFLAGAAAVLLLFLFKALFKWRKNEDELRMEIVESEQPELFAFIRMICQEIIWRRYEEHLAPGASAAEGEESV